MVCLVAFASLVAAAVDDATLRRLEAFSRALYHIEKSYITPVDNERLIQSAMFGMLRSLDAHSAFLDKRQLDTLKLAEGSVGRTGLLLNDREGVVVVAAVAENSPAARADIAASDVLISVDGIPTSRASDAEQQLLGKPGSKVEVVVNRAGFVVPRQFVLERERLPSEAARWVQVGERRVLRLSYFPEGVATTVRQLLQDYSSQDSLIIDLRDNPGGLVEQAMRVMELVSDGELGAFAVRQGRANSVRRQRKAVFSGTICLWVNQGTASAAEMLAAGLRAAGRARLVGAKTYGKGSVQTVFEFGDGTAIKLTTGRYVDRDGRDFDGVGLHPNDLLNSDQLTDSGYASRGCARP